MNYKVTKLITVAELPQTHVLAEARTFTEAVELKKFYDELYRGEIVSIESPMIEAVSILKQEYNLDYTVTDIEAWMTNGEPSAKPSARELAEQIAEWEGM